VHTEPAVIGAAAGALFEPEAERALRGQCVVYLRAGPDLLAERVKSGMAHRPLDDHAAQTLHEQYAVRDPRYMQLASVVVDANARPDDVLNAVISALAES
jgi:shikimate kinase